MPSKQKVSIQEKSYPAMFKFLVCLFLNLIVGNSCASSISLYLMSIVAIFMCSLTQVFFYVNAAVKGLLFIFFMAGGLAITLKKCNFLPENRSYLAYYVLLFFPIFMVVFRAKSLFFNYFLVKSFVIFAISLFVAVRDLPFFRKNGFLVFLSVKLFLFIFFIFAFLGNSEIVPLICKLHIEMVTALRALV